IVKIASGWCPERRKFRKAEIPRQIVDDRLLTKILGEVTVHLHAACPLTSPRSGDGGPIAWIADEAQGADQSVRHAARPISAIRSNASSVSCSVFGAPGAGLDPTLPPTSSNCTHYPTRNVEVGRVDAGADGDQTAV